MPETSNKNANALEIFNSCIRNGEEILNAFEKEDDVVKNNSIFKSLIEKIKDDTKSIENLKKKVDDLRYCEEARNYQKWKTELVDMIDNLKAVSCENLIKINEAVAASNASKLKKKFDENEKTIESVDAEGDERVRKFALILLQKNKKIVDCLKFANSLIPKYFDKSHNECQKTKRKLFIVNDDHLGKMSQLDRSNFEPMGEVDIQCKIQPHMSTRIDDYPAELSGYLQNENGEKVEVILKLKNNFSLNLIDFSMDDVESKMSATLAIQGQLEELEIVEISLNEDHSPMLLATIQNDVTGGIEKIPVQLISLTPEKNIHGKVIEIEAPSMDEENLDDIELSLINDSSISYHTTPQRSQKHDNIITDLQQSFRMDQAVAHVQDLLAPAMERIIENTTEKIVNAIVEEHEKNLDDISEIEYADLSTDTSTQIRNVSRRNYEDNLINFSAATPIKSRAPLPSNKVLSPMRERPMRGRNYLNQSMPISRNTGIKSSTRNKTLPSNMQYRYPIDVVPSRIPLDAPFPQQRQQFVQPVMQEQKKFTDYSPMRPDENQRMNEALEKAKHNPFAKYPQNQTGTVRRQSLEPPQNYLAPHQNNNTSLPSHLTPKKAFTPQELEKSLMGIYDALEKTKARQEQLEKNLQNNTSQRVNQYQPPNIPENEANLMDMSDPFSDSFENILKEENQFNSNAMRAQPADQFAARFDTGVNLLEDMSFDFMNDISINSSRKPPHEISVDDIHNSFSSPRRIRVLGEQRAPRRKRDKSPRINQNVKGKILDYE